MKFQISWCQEVQKISKKSRKYQFYVMCQRMSNVKKSNTLTMHEVHKKINLTQWGSHTMRSHNVERPLPPSPALCPTIKWSKTAQKYITYFCPCAYTHTRSDKSHIHLPIQKSNEPPQNYLINTKYLPAAKMKFSCALRLLLDPFWITTRLENLSAVLDGGKSNNANGQW